MASLGGPGRADGARSSKIGRELARPRPGQQRPKGADKEYLKILHTAARQGEARVEAALLRLMDRQQPLCAAAVDAEVRQILIDVLDREIGTREIASAATYLERPLRLVAHLIMSSPQYQLC